VIQPVTAVLRDRHEVPDAHPELALEVDAGFDGEHHPRLQRLVVAVHDVGFLVDVEADAVAGAVDERLAVARGLDDLAGGSIDRFRWNPGFDSLDGGLLCLADDVVDRLELVGGSPSKTTVRVWSLG